MRQLGLELELIFWLAVTALDMIGWLGSTKFQDDGRELYSRK